MLPDSRTTGGQQGPSLAPPARAPRLTSRLRGLAARAIPRAVLVRRGPVNDRRVALTFDDGPDDMTDAYLDVLARYDVRATFFVVGDPCTKHREALERVSARGHELAGHGFTHRPFPEMDLATLRDELRRTSQLLPRPANRAMVRPPRGATSLWSLAVCAHAGYTTVLWSRDSDDCRTSSSADVAARVAPATLHPGEIVLMHEGQTWTLEALPRILEALAATGWKAVTVGELLNSGRA